MKKLLSILGALCIVSSSSLSVVACGSSDEENKHLGDDGNSIWAFLPALGKDNQSATSADVWNQIDPFAGASKDFNMDPSSWDPTTRENAEISILRILNVSILANAKKVFTEAKFTGISDLADYSTLADSLSKAWDKLKSSVEQQVKDKHDEYIKNGGKDGEKQWQKFLDDNYDGKKNNYEASLLATGTDNATTELKDVLLGGQRGYNVNEGSVCKQEFIDDFIKENKSAGDVDKWVDSNPDIARNIAMAYTKQTLPSDSKTANIWNLDSNLQLTPNAIKPRLKQLYTAFTSNPQQVNVPDLPDSMMRNINATPQEVPTTVKSFSDNKSKFYAKRSYNENASAVDGFYSEIQRYELSKWFSIKKPLATSQIDISFDSNSDKLDHQITSDDFKSNKDLIRDIFDSSKNMGSWSSLNNSSKIDGVKVTWNTKLMTMDSTATPPPSSTNGIKDGASNDFGKIVVYDALTDGQGWTTVDAKGKTADDYIAKNLLPYISRNGAKPTANNVGDGDHQYDNMYLKLRLGGTSDNADNDVIVYVDDSGMHIVHIDGYDPSSTKFNNAGITPQNDWKVTNEQRNVDLDGFLYHLSSAQRNDKNNIKDSDLLGGFQTTSAINAAPAATDGPYAFNTHIHNRYLQFLTNVGYMSKDLNRPYAFSSVKDAITTFANFDSSTTAGSPGAKQWYTWSYDIFNHMFNEVLSNNGHKDWLSNFITFYDNKGNKSDGKWFTNEIGEVDSRLTLPDASLSTFYGSITKQNKAIDEYAVNWPTNIFDLDAIKQQLNASGTNATDFWNWEAKK